MLMLTQTGCAIPTALSCCAWETAVTPVTNPATPAVNTAIVLTTGTTLTLPTGTVNDSILVHNNSPAPITVDPISDTLKVGEVVSYVHNGTAWARG